jgi:hypothetical protein
MMDTATAKTLQIDERVIWDRNDESGIGTVKATHPRGVYFEWEDGRYGWIWHDDMARIERYDPNVDYDAP